jgi:cytochrome b561
MSNSNSSKYSGIAILIHWLMALLIVVAFAMGLYMVDLSFSMARVKLFNYHKWLGITILALAALRLLWRLFHRAPGLPNSMPSWQKVASHGTHWLMYALFFATPLLGWAYSSATGFQVVYLGLFPLPNWVGKDKELAKVLEDYHAYAAYALAAIVVLHVAAAIKHAIIDKDGVMSRMLPGAR